MESSQPPPSRYPPSMGPGARKVGEPEPGSLQDLIQIRRQYNIEKLDEGLKLEYKLKGLPRSFVVPYTAFPCSGMLTSTRLYTHITGSFFIDNIRAVENTTGIPHTQQSVQAFAEHSSKVLIWKQVGNVATIFTALAFWSKGRADMKFPLRGAKPLSKYNNFPNRFIPIIKGPLARTLWQGTRFGVLMLYGILLLKPLFSSVGRGTMAIGLERDNRVRHMMEALRNNRKERIVGKQQRSTGNRSAQPAPQTASPSSEDYVYGEQPTDSMVDGYSEAGVSYSDGMGTTGDVSSGSQPGTQQSYQNQRPQQPQQYQQRSRAPEQSTSSPSTHQSSSSDDPFAFNEDPLPDSSSDPDSPRYNPNASQPKPRRSWASIRNEARRDAQAANNPNSQGSPYSNASGSAYPDSGSFQNTDTYGAQSASSPRGRKSSAPPTSENYGYGAAQGEAERQREQREFDALLDRERRLGQQGDGSGGSGGSGGGRGGAWGRGSS